MCAQFSSSPGESRYRNTSKYVVLFFFSKINNANKVAIIFYNVREVENQ